jgi:hypothetical protein
MQTNLRPTQIVALLGALLVAAFGTGCASQSTTFPDRPRNQVWTAMVAVAENPDYPDWRLVDNEVAVSPDADRILIHRRVRRNLIEPGSPMRQQDRDWVFEIRLFDTEPPKAVFSSPTMVVPVWLRQEADRYFRSVRELLGESPQAPAAQRVAASPPQSVRE